MEEAMKSGKRACAHCGKLFKPKTPTQKYHSKTCQNRAGQKRVRERAKRTTELESVQNGVLGASNG
jgi:hypothetical protein